MFLGLLLFVISFSGSETLYPSVKISFPIDFADVDYQNSTLAIISNSYPAFDLICNASYPIQWNTFQYEDDDGTSSKDLKGTTQRLVSDFEKPDSYNYSAILSIQFTGKLFVFSNYSCVSPTNVELQTNVVLLPKSHKNVIEMHITSDKKFFQLEESQPHDNSTCKVFASVSGMDEPKSCWNCETAEGQDLKLDFIGCQTPIECNGVYKRQNRGSKCLKIIPNGVNHTGCKMMGALDYEPKIIICKNYGPALAQFYYFDVPQSKDKAPTMYFNWDEMDPEKMVYIHPLQDELFFGQNVTITCEMSKYYFSSGSWFGVVVGNKTTYHQTEDVDENLNSFWVKGAFSSSINLTLTNPGPSKVICSAPVWNSTEWINASISLNVKEGTPPRIVSLTLEDKVDKDEFTIGETNRSLICHFKGNPPPEVEWDGPNSGYHKTETDFSKSLSKLIFPEITYASAGNYSCTVKSFLGSETQWKSFDVETDQESASRFVKSIISVACILVVVLGIAAIFVFIRLRRIIKRQREALRLLTDSEIKEFVEGNPEFLSRNDYFFDKALLIDSIPYDKKYEVGASNMSIEYSRLLGCGAFGKVYKGRIRKRTHSEDSGVEESSFNERSSDGHKNVEVAIKTCEKNVDVLYFKALLSEVKIMAYIGHHKNVVSLIGACTQNIRKRELYVAVEYCPKGSLESFLRLHRSNFVNRVQYGYLLADSTDKLEASSESVMYNNIQINEVPDINLSTTDLLKWVYDVSNGMDYLHFRKVIHGDLAARNILLTEDLVAKIGDFGLARQLVECSNYVKKTQGPIPWRHFPPESLRNLEFSVKSDIWAFGVLIWEIFTLAETPYGGISYNNQFLLELEHGHRLTKPVFSTNDLYEFMLKCWKVNPEDRPVGFNEIKSICIQSLKLTAENDPTVSQDYFELCGTSGPHENSEGYLVPNFPN